MYVVYNTDCVLILTCNLNSLTKNVDFCFVFYYRHHPYSPAKKKKKKKILCASVPYFFGQIEY